MKNFYIADLYLGDANIIQMDGRPFTDLHDMHRTIVERWNGIICGDDTVCILGDFCWGKEEQWMEFLTVLAGKKVLIRGNHSLGSVDTGNEHRVVNLSYPVEGLSLSRGIPTSTSWFPRLEQ